jgi:hypothetical protein
MKDISTKLKGQELRIYRLLRDASGEWVGLPQILALGIAQHSARLWSLKHKRGLPIENKLERENGVTRSWYRLPVPAPAKPATSATPSLFTEPLTQFCGGM